MSENIMGEKIVDERDVEIAFLREENERLNQRLSDLRQSWMDRVKQVQALDSRLAQAREMLMLILPLAKGYAAEHQVGSNAAYVHEAEDALRALEEPQ